jgi:hypothetical protein
MRQFLLGLLVRVAAETVYRQVLMPQVCAAAGAAHHERRARLDPRVGSLQKPGR